MILISSLGMIQSSGITYVSLQVFCLQLFFFVLWAVVLSLSSEQNNLFLIFWKPRFYTNPKIRKIQENLFQMAMVIADYVICFPRFATREIFQVWITEITTIQSISSCF